MQMQRPRKIHAAEADAQTRREVRLERRGSANGDKRASLIIQNKACVLREKDIMQAEDATSRRADLFSHHDDVSRSRRGRRLLQPLRFA
jgi:hypothetical protein